MTERWLPVLDFEGWYSVSDKGRVRSETRIVIGKDSVRQTHKGQQLRCGPGWNGRPFVTLRQPGRSIKRQVAHLVLESFISPRPPGKEALHWDDDRTNNKLSNLRWGTRSENLQDSIRNGIHNYAKRTQCEFGHEFSVENTIIRPGGARRCKECKRRRAREYWHRRGAIRRSERQEKAS